MLLSYLIALGLLAYIVYLFARSYDRLADEVRDMRVKCVGTAKLPAKAAGAKAVVASLATSVAAKLKAAT
jgi:hypothetical protein